MLGMLALASCGDSGADPPTAPPPEPPVNPLVAGQM